MVWQILCGPSLSFPYPTPYPLPIPVPIPKSNESETVAKHVFPAPLPRLATSCKWHSCNLCSAYTLGSSSSDFGIFWSQKFQWIHSSSIHFAAIDSLHLKSLPFSVSLVGSSVLRGLGRWGRKLKGYRVLNCMRKVAGKVTKVFLQFYRQTVLLSSLFSTFGSYSLPSVLSYFFFFILLENTGFSPSLIDLFLLSRLQFLPQVAYSNFKTNKQQLEIYLPILVSLALLDSEF